MDVNPKKKLIPRPRKYMVYPKIQIKFALIHVFVVAAGFIGAAWVASGLNRQVADLAAMTNDVLILTQIRALQERQIFIIALVGLVSAFICFGIAVLVTHRFVGPIVALIRYFEELRTGGDANLRIRDHDGLDPLVDYLRSVKIEVSDREE